MRARALLGECFVSSAPLLPYLCALPPLDELARNAEIKAEIKKEAEAC